MLPSNAECYGDDYEGSEGDEPQAGCEGTSGLSCIEYDH